MRLEVGGTQRVVDSVPPLSRRLSHAPHLLLPSRLAQPPSVADVVRCLTPSAMLRV